MTESNIGTRIRQLREDAGLSLRGLAERCGLSFNAISRIEHGENSPTVATLHRLAAALNVQITDFFTQGPAQMTIFTKEGQGFSTDSEDVIIESLGSSFQNQQIEVFRLIIQPGSSTMQTPVAHSGEEFVLCLNGRITYHIAEQAYDLEMGDSLLFKAIQPHSWENHTNTLATVLIVFQSVQDHPLLWQRHSF